MMNKYAKTQKTELNSAQIKLTEKFNPCSWFLFTGWLLFKLFPASWIKSKSPPRK